MKSLHCQNLLQASAFPMIEFALVGVQLPHGEKIEYIPWDFKRCAKRRGSRILTELSPCIKRSLKLTSLFVFAPTSSTDKGGDSQGKTVRKSCKSSRMRKLSTVAKHFHRCEDQSGWVHIEAYFAACSDLSRHEAQHAQFAEHSCHVNNDAGRTSCVPERSLEDQLYGLSRSHKRSAICAWLECPRAAAAWVGYFREPYARYQKQHGYRAYESIRANGQHSG